MLTVKLIKPSILEKFDHPDRGFYSFMCVPLIQPSLFYYCYAVFPRVEPFPQLFGISSEVHYSVGMRRCLRYVIHLSVCAVDIA